MTNFLSLLYVGPQQLVPVAVGFVLWVGLAGLGYLVTPKTRALEASPFIGWAVVSTVFTLIGVIVPQPFLALSVLGGLGALAGITLALRRRETFVVPGSWRVLVLALPLLAIMGAMGPSQWDEFSHWLPAPKYLLLYDGFPTAERPDAGPQMLPAYPYAWPFLIYLAARIAGRFLDNVGGILNMLMLLTFATFALRTAFAVTGRPRGAVIGWPLAAGIVLTATLFNPTLVQKIVLTSYSDVACSVVTGVALLLGYRLLQQLAGRATGSTGTAIWELALALALLVNIRQPNSVVVGAVLVALALVAWRDREISLPRFFRAAVLAVSPALIVYAAWRWYVSAHFSLIVGAEAAIRPLDHWNIAVVPQILAAMAVVASKKIAFFAPLTIACVVAVRALVRGARTDFDRISILTATVFVAYNAFLLFIYVAHFAPRDALSATSYWRYNVDIGSIAIIFIAVGALTLWSRYRSFDSYPRWAAPAAAVLVVFLPVAFADKIRFDLEPPKPHFFAVARDMHALGLDNARIRLLDPHGTGEAGVITRYVLNNRGQSWISSFQNTTANAIPDYLGTVEPGDYLLVHSVSQVVMDALGRTLDPRRSYLFRRGDDGWTLIKDWLKPADHPW